MNPLKLGVIGLSPGNGHPYSWSAIFNGYDRDYMESCGFPVIPRYLEKQRFPEDAIAEAKVTHVWTQERSLSDHVARASLIPNVVDSYTDMIGQVDGILLARDDAETHLEFAASFLEAGLPVYIDKPLALSVAEGQKLLTMQQYPGQIYSCSALRYAREFKLTQSDRESIGTIKHLHVIVPKDWDKYAVHVIEPALMLAAGRGALISTRTWKSGDTTTFSARYESGLQLLVNTMGAAGAPLSLRVIGENGWKDMFFQDTYFAFKSALHEFVQGVLNRDVRIEPDFMLEVVGLIEAGRAE